MKASYSELETQWHAVDHGPTKTGRVVLLVTRGSAADMPKGQDKLSTPLHRQPKTIRFSVEDGVQGDRWKKGKDVLRQVSLTSLAVTKLVAGPQDCWHLTGNNLIVDFDLCAEVLPVGSRLRLGTGEVEISAAPHDPCDRYEARFGQSASHWVGDEIHAHRHLRGRMARIVRGGEVSVNDPILLLPT